MDHINAGFYGQGCTHSNALRPKRSIHDLYHEHLLLPVSDTAHDTANKSSKRHRCRGKALRRRAAGARPQGANPARAVQSAPTSPEMEIINDSSMVDFDCCKPPLSAPAYKTAFFASSHPDRIDIANAPASPPRIPTSRRADQEKEPARAAADAGTFAVPVLPPRQANTTPKLHKLKPVLKLALPDLGPDEGYTCQMTLGKSEEAGSVAPTSALAKAGQPRPLLSPIAHIAAAPCIPPTLSLSHPKTPVSPVPSFSNRRQRNAKHLFLHVPTEGSGTAAASATSRSGLHLLTEPPHSPGTLDLSETRSCPPTPRLLIDTDNNDEEMIDVEKREELKSSLQGDITMKRRTSLPRLNVKATRLCLSINTQAAGSGFTDQPPPTPGAGAGARPNRPAAPLIVENLVARNREAGAPADVDSLEALEDFPYQNGPKEILPGLFLGSEQNAKDPTCLRALGISTVLCVAKEVACPWLTEDVTPEDTDEKDARSEEDESASSTSASTFSSTSDSKQEIERLCSGSGEGAWQNRIAAPSSCDARRDSAASRHGPMPPARPLLVRPTASTPNLQQRFREVSPETVVGSAARLSAKKTTSPSLLHPGSGPDLASSIGVATPLPPVQPLSTRRAAPAHTGYLFRQFPSNRSSGRPALEYTKLPWGHDEDDIATHFETYSICETVDRARQNGGRCLVHCQLGVSRSATLMIGYCLRQALKGNEDVLADVRTMHDSYTYVRSKSRWVAPNIGLLAQLVQYERVLAESCANPPGASYTNSAYYDSQLSLQKASSDSSSPDDLSPSSTSESEVDSRLTTPEGRSDARHPPSAFKRQAALATPLLSASRRVEEQLSPMAAAMRISRSAEPDTVAFGTLSRERDHRKTFSADLSKFFESPVVPVAPLTPQ